MKKILAALLAFVASAAFGATLSPITLLNPAGSSSGQAIVSTGSSSAPAWGGIGVNGIAAIAANTVLANATASSASPTAFAMPSCTGAPNALGWNPGSGFTCNSSITPTVATNAALQALSTVTTSTVTRLGFTTAGDSPPLNYTASGSACSLNSGAGDNGSQVKSANNLCWLANFPLGPLDVREFGADPTGVADSTTAIQAALNTGKLTYYHGSFKFSTLSFTAGGMIGDGAELSSINSTDTSTANTITFNGVASAVFRDMGIYGQSSKTTGAGLFVTGPSGGNGDSLFENLIIANFPTDLQFGAAAGWSIQNCFIFSYINYGVIVANTSNPDSGDSVIMGSEFVVTSGNPTGILYQSSGGLKVIGNKFNGNQYGFYLGLNASASTSDLLIEGNSIEGNFTTGQVGIALTRASGTATFSNIIIVGNQFAGDLTGVLTDTSGAFFNLLVDSNSIELSSGSGSGINLQNVATFHVGGNVIQGNGGTPTGIVVTSSSTNGKIDKNTYKSLTTTLNNSSTTTFAATDAQTTSTSVTSSSAYGSLFSGNTAVSFPQTYTVAPTVTCFPTAGSGFIAAFPISITTSGFTVVAVSTSNITATVSCTANGIY